MSRWKITAEVDGVQPPEVGPRCACGDDGHPPAPTCFNGTITSVTRLTPATLEERAAAAEAALRYLVDLGNYVTETITRAQFQEAVATSIRLHDALPPKDEGNG